jgi:hypothetical protein
MGCAASKCTKTKTLRRANQERTIMARANLEDRIAKIDDHLFALLGDIQLFHPLADVRAWHRKQLQNLVMDARLDEARYLTDKINAIFDSKAS